MTWHDRRHVRSLDGSENLKDGGKRSDVLSGLVCLPSASKPGRLTSTAYIGKIASKRVNVNRKSLILLDISKV
jgi:hypothetical protein